jgi:Fe-S-cluster containining protein
MDRCTGHCCRQFFLPFTPAQLVKHALTRFVRPRFKPEEIAKVAAMAVYLGDRSDGAHMYTCRHLNVITGDCMDYENRPDVCRDYPYEDVCMHAAKGCTWDAARAGTAGTRFRLPVLPTDDLPPEAVAARAEALAVYKPEVAA